MTEKQLSWVRRIAIRRLCDCHSANCFLQPARLLAATLFFIQLALNAAW